MLEIILISVRSLFTCLILGYWKFNAFIINHVRYGEREFSMSYITKHHKTPSVSHEITLFFCSIQQMSCVSSSKSSYQLFPGRFRIGWWGSAFSDWLRLIFEASNSNCNGDEEWPSFTTFHFRSTSGYLIFPCRLSRSFRVLVQWMLIGSSQISTFTLVNKALKISWSHSKAQPPLLMITKRYSITTVTCRWGIDVLSSAFQGAGGLHPLSIAQRSSVQS